MGGPLISTAKLNARLGAPDLRVLDASWHLDGTDARAAFERERVPGARFFDLEAVSDRDSPLPHMLPSAEAFARSMGALGVSETDEIVVYDTLGLFSAARAWWMLRIMGARRVRVLNGGLPAWRAEGRPLEHGAVIPPTPTIFAASLDAEAVAGGDDVGHALETGAATVIDARPAARFAGEAPEPRPGLALGHMPGARSLPFKSLLDGDGRLRPAAELAVAFAEAGVDPQDPVITSCGSGVTAAVLNLALETLGRPARLYDGSWAEWGAPGGGPVATGPA